MAGDEDLWAPASNGVRGGEWHREEGEWEEGLTTVLLRLTAGSARTGRRRIGGDQSSWEREIREGRGTRGREEEIRQRGGGGEEGTGRRAGAPGGLQRRAGRQEVVGAGRRAHLPLCLLTGGGR